MKTSYLLSSTVIIASAIVFTNTAQAAVTNEAPELLSHPLFQKRAVQTKSPLSEGLSSPDISRSLPKLSTAKETFEAPEKTPSVSLPSQEKPYSLFELLEGVSLSSLLTYMEPEKEQVVSAPVNPPRVKSTPAENQGWGSWAGNLFTTVKGALGFGTIEETKPTNEPAKPSAPKIETPENQSYQWPYNTMNWVSEAFWGTHEPKAQPTPVSLEDIAGMDTLRLPGLLGTIFEGGWNNQAPDVLAALDAKLDQTHKKYDRHEALKLSEARRKAQFVSGMNGVWVDLNVALPKRTRARSF